MGNLEDESQLLDDLTSTNLLESFDLDDFVELDDLQIFEMFKVSWKNNFLWISDKNVKMFYVFH